jgi:hypothetical protein
MNLLIKPSPPPHPMQNGRGRSMGMATGNPKPRNPYKLLNGLMRCEWCRCTYSRGGFCSAYNTNGTGSTLPPVLRILSIIPDDVCPSCKRKEETHDR